MFEHHRQPLLPRTKFYLRQLRYVLIALLLIGWSLGIGVIGYHYFDALPWIDSILNAAMILTGMGPVDELKSDGAKWFASAYAIFSGIAFLSIVAVLLSPLVHRFLHILHLNEDAK